MCADSLVAPILTIWNRSCVTCHLSSVTCNLLPDTYHMSPYNHKLQLLWKSQEAALGLIIKRVKKINKKMKTNSNFNLNNFRTNICDYTSLSLFNKAYTKGTDRQTNRQTDIATYRLNQPRGRFRWIFYQNIQKVHPNVLGDCERPIDYSIPVGQNNGIGGGGLNWKAE